MKFICRFGQFAYLLINATLSPMQERSTSVAQKLVDPKKGILSANENSMFLFNTAHIQENISGVILENPNSIRFLQEKRIEPGARLDLGLETFGNFGEQSSKWIPRAFEQASEFKNKGITFVEIRSVYKITSDTPTDELLKENANFQAFMANAAISSGLIAIVKPEILTSGEYGIETAEKVSLKILASTIGELKSENVDLTKVLISPNMVMSGIDSKERPTALEIARTTVRVLIKTIPHQIPGIVFSDGNQTPMEATFRLEHMNRMFGHVLPWQLSFSFGEALQSEALKIYAGKPENLEKAQDAFLKRVRLASLARQGII